MRLFESKEERFRKTLALAEEEARVLVLPGEEIKDVFLLSEDFLILTSKRILLIDKTIGSNQRSIVTIPYNKIESVSLAKSNTSVFSPEVEISVGSSYFDLRLRNPQDAVDFYRKLSNHILP